MNAPFTSQEQVEEALAKQRYMADRSLVTAVFLALRLGKPLLLEGEAGVGKTELAKALAAALSSELIRLQCYEGIEVSQALYEWDYPRQLLHIRLLESRGAAGAVEQELYSRQFLLRRPLLLAIDGEFERPPVLLIDEIDRADAEFEAFLLELLSDYQVTIPELGTITASVRPVVVLTSNRTREVHDALKRRCIFHWIPYPSPERELEIVLARIPEATAANASKVVEMVQRLRRLDLFKPPGVAETLDWAQALGALGWNGDEGTVRASLGAVIKSEEDLATVQEHLSELTQSGGE